MRKISKVLFAAGALLVLASFGLLAFSQLRANAAKKETAGTISIRNLRQCQTFMTDVPILRAERIRC